MFNIMDQKKKKYLLMIGFIILLCSILIAYDSPAKSYELSIYESTPIAYWIGIGTVIIMSLIVSFDSNKEELSAFLILAGIAIISIVSLPIIRNYYYFGMADSISHLGLANSIAKGNIDVSDFFYPAIHLLGVFISSLTGLSLRTSMMLNIPLFAVVYLLFIPLVLKKIHGKFNKDLMIIGAYSAFLFLPINNIGIHFQPHPSSQAVLFFPVLIFLFLKYNSEKNNKLFIIFVLLFLGLLLIHPQQALSFILLTSIIVLWSRWYKKDNSFSIRLPLLFGLLFWMWVSYNYTFQKSLSTVFNRLFYGDLEISAGVTQRGMSLILIGGNLIELILKMFLVTLIFGILTLLYLFKKRNAIIINKDWIKYLIIGMVPITLMFTIYFFTVPGPNQAFRYLGIICMLITITGAYSLFLITKHINLKTKNVFILIFISANLLLSVPIYFDSSWIYTPNPQITENDYYGYATTFSVFNKNLNFSSVQLASDRFYVTIQGINRTSELRRKFITSPDHFNNQSLSTYYKSRTYLAVTESELIIDAQLYQGFRFSFDDFKYLARDQNINKIQSNGGYKLYIIYPAES